MIKFNILNSGKTTLKLGDGGTTSYSPHNYFTYNSERGITGLKQDESINVKFTYTNQLSQQVTDWKIPTGRTAGLITDPYATSICDGLFNNYAAYMALTTYDKSPMAVKFENVKTIGERSFAYCGQMLSAEFASATSIANYAFKGCSTLSSISFPNVTSIGIEAFADCVNLVNAQMKFPKVTSIDDNAFLGCTNVSKIELDSMTQAEVEENIWWWFEDKSEMDVKCILTETGQVGWCHLEALM